MIVTRRSLLKGMTATGLLLAAPAIVRMSSLMPVKAAPLVARVPFGTVDPAWIEKMREIRHFLPSDMSRVASIGRDTFYADDDGFFT